MDLDVRVISIGALDQHPLWGERQPVRTGHATTTLIRSEDRVILVDPGLPAQALVPRLAERANIGPDDVTHVFLTSFRPDVRRALPAFEDATWWVSETERESVGVPMAEGLRRAVDEGEDELADALRQDVVILSKCRPAPDRIAERVDLFPLPGVTPGMSGLLVADPRHTLLICGDAIPTVEHLAQGKAPQRAVDLDRAKESFSEAIEIADMLILGRDNMVVNPLKRPF